tara:strand:- start:89 stop:211 length:123 start_codon:yes stop_codon:yes gene_type:complete
MTLFEKKSSKAASMPSDKMVQETLNNALGADALVVFVRVL